jgi:hypothetical protein
VLGEPLIVDFSAENGSGTSAVLDLGLDREGGFSFDISAPDGHSVHVSAPLQEGASVQVRVGQFSISPGETYRQRLWLSKWYSFNKPGVYDVTGSLAGC